MKLTSIEIAGMRSIANIKLELNGLTALIGENGSGKSTILEAFELLRRCTDSNFLAAVHEIHGGVPALLASGATRLSIKAVVEDDSDRFEYAICLQLAGEFFVIVEEKLEQRYNAPTPLMRFRRNRDEAQVFVPRKGGKGKLENVRSDPSETLLSSTGLQMLSASGDEDAAMLKIVAAKKAFANTQIHAAVNTTAAWVARALKADQPLRQAQELSNSDVLNATYDNLASVLHNISQGANATLSRRVYSSLELAFGERFEGLRFPTAGAGHIQLHAQFRGLDRAVSARSLSDGQLAYIALVAAFVSGEKRALLAIDEPEIHLHPALIARMVSVAEITAQKTQVILATHSRNVLDALKEPVQQAVLCELNQHGQTVLKRPNAESLRIWLKNYDGLGALVAEGYASEVFV
jgi:predicted ATPase